MKILFFINGIHPGGKERRMIELMKELKLRQQTDFQLIVMNSEISYPEIYDLKIKIHFLIRKTTKDFRVFRKLYKICKQYKPNIIHCWDSMTVVYAIPICKLLNIKLINGMIVDTPVIKNFSNKNWLRGQVTFPFSNIIVGNSQAGLRAYKAPVKKSMCIYNGIDLSRFQNLEDPIHIRKALFGNQFEHVFIVGMVAAFELRKDYKTLIEAAIMLVSKHVDLRFLLIGGGSYLNQSKSSIPRALSDKIIFLGKQSNVESLINIFDIAILLTNAKVHGEGVSNSIIEYMALCKPVIATRGGGTDEVITENENGFLIEPNNKDHLIEKIEFLMKNEKRNTIGQVARKTVEERFNLKIMTDQYTNIYQDLFTSKKLINLLSLHLLAILTL